MWRVAACSGIEWHRIAWRALRGGAAAHRAPAAPHLHYLPLPSTTFHYLPLPSTTFHYLPLPALPSLNLQHLYSLHFLHYLHWPDHQYLHYHHPSLTVAAGVAWRERACMHAAHCLDTTCIKVQRCGEYRHAITTSSSASKWSPPLLPTPSTRLGKHAVLSRHSPRSDDATVRNASATM